MDTITYVDTLHPRSRGSWLIFVLPSGEVIPFTGASIPRVAAATVAGTKRNGKWSSTTYSVTLAPDVRAIQGRDGWETGSFAEGLRTAVRGGQGVRPTRWFELAELLGVTVEQAQAFMRSWRPKGAAAIDASESAVAAMLA